MEHDGLNYANYEIDARGRQFCSRGSRERRGCHHYSSVRSRERYTTSDELMSTRVDIPG